MNEEKVRKCPHCGYIVKEPAQVRCPRCNGIVIRLTCSGSCSKCREQNKCEGNC